MLWVTRYDSPPTYSLLFMSTTNIYTNDTFQSVIEKKKTLSASEIRRKKKERMARRKRGEEVFSDEE